jgi:uncharacterized repeat protein (TIGR01451 family)
MKRCKILSVVALNLFFVFFVFTGSVAYSESLYVTDHSNHVFSFDIINGAIEFRNSLSVPGSGGGIDLEIDDAHDILFRTVEFASTIDIIEAQSLTYIKTIALPVRPDAGIVYDADHSRLLCTKRNSNQLYIFLWDPALQTLTYQPPYIVLGQIQNACDLAINGNVLYVSEYLYSGTPAYSEVYAFDMSDDFSIIGKIEMDHPTVSIDYHAADDSIYGGAWMGHQNIIKKSFDPDMLTFGNIGTSATGVATNGEIAGRVFITSYRDGGSIEWWDLSDPDPNNWELADDYTNSNSDGVTLLGLAGLAVGRNYIAPTIILTKTDDSSGCMSPGDELTYTLCITNYSETETATGVVLIDYLPMAVDYAGASYAIDPNFNIIPPDPGYHPQEHAYVWHIGNIAPQDSNTVSLTVEVNWAAAPGMPIENKAVATSDNLGSSVDRLETEICCWDSGTLIYVDKTATGTNTGLNWENAYLDLADALDRAENSLCGGPFIIYVAAGTYAPIGTPDMTFASPDSCSMYGGFPSGGCNFSQRNPKKYITVLTGLIDDDAFPDADAVVTMGQDSLIDGFTVTQAFEQAIYGNGVDFSVTNCIVADSFRYGIYAVDGDVTIQWCTIRLNSSDGIRHEGIGYGLSVSNSWMLRNGEYGIYSVNSTPVVKNCIVSESDLARQGRAGIRLYHPTYQPVLHNLTVSNNKSAGIFFEDNGDIYGNPNNKDWPDLQNSIVYYNNPTGEQLAGLNPDMVANFCVIQDCNELNTTNYNRMPGFAYVVDPNGVPDPNNYHLAYNSFCIDKANPYLSYTNQVDIDGEGLDRQYGDYVDIGADEVYDCSDEILTDIDVHNDLDQNADGIVNFTEMAAFSRSWLARDPNSPLIITDPNFASDPDYADPNTLARWRQTWNPNCNLIITGDSVDKIDLADLMEFTENGFWLWAACWKLEEIEAAAAQSQSQSMMMQPLLMMAVEPQSIESEPEPSLDTLVQIVGFLDEVVITEQPDNIENIQGLRAYLMDEIWVLWSRQNE